MKSLINFDNQIVGNFWWKGDYRLGWNFCIGPMAVNFVKIGWSAKPEISYIDMVYHLGIPSVESTFYKPYPAFCNKTMRCIMFYDPREDPPSEDYARRMAYPYEPILVPGGYTDYQSYMIAADLIRRVDADAKEGIFIPGNPNRIRIIYVNEVSHEGFKLYNNIEWFPHPAWGTGGYTEKGGYWLTSPTYRNTKLQVGLFQDISHLYIPFKFITNMGIQYESSAFMGYYSYFYAITPKQYILFRNPNIEGFLGDIAKNATSLVISMPCTDDIISYLSGCAFKIGAKYYGAVIVGGYPGGGIENSLNHVGEDVGILVGGYEGVKVSPTGNAHAVPGWGNRTFWGYTTPCGVSFPTFRSPLRITALGKPTVAPAYVALPLDPTKRDSKTRIFGSLWNSIMVSTDLPLGSVITYKRLPWLCISSQKSAPLGATPASLLTLSRIYYKQEE